MNYSYPEHFGWIVSVVFRYRVFRTQPTSQPAKPSQTDMNCVSFEFFIMRTIAISDHNWLITEPFRFSALSWSFEKNAINYFIPRATCEWHHQPTATTQQSYLLRITYMYMYILQLLFRYKYIVIVAEKRNCMTIRICTTYRIHIA